MEKLKITRLGEPKTINYTNKKTGKPDSFQKIGFQSQEQGDRWYDFLYRGEHGLAVGQTYEFITKSREYNGKTYWDAELPKKADMNLEAAIGPLKTTLGKHEFNIDELKIMVKGLALLVKKTPDEIRTLVQDHERGYPYPESTGEPDFDVDFGKF